MEQVEGGDLVVNRGEESRPKDDGSEGRDLNTVDGYEAALKLAQVRENIPIMPYLTYLVPGKPRRVD